MKMSRDLGDTTWRVLLLKRALEKGISSSILKEITEPMHGKTNEEKEILAKQLLSEVESGKIKPDGPHDRSKYAPFL